MGDVGCFHPHFVLCFDRMRSSDLHGRRFLSYLPSFFPCSRRTRGFPTAGFYCQCSGIEPPFFSSFCSPSLSKKGSDGAALEFTIHGVSGVG